MTTQVIKSTKETESPDVTIILRSCSPIVQDGVTPVMEIDTHDVKMFFDLH